MEAHSRALSVPSKAVRHNGSGFSSQLRFQSEATKNLLMPEGAK